MKKIMMAAAIVCAAAFAQAASVSWSVSGSQAADAGKTIYILTSVAASYESVSAFTATTLGSAAIEGKTSRGKTTYATAVTTTSDSSIAKDSAYYLAVISGDQKTAYFYTVAAGSGMVYDPAKQESSPGTYSLAVSSIEGSSSTAKIGKDDPDPGPIPEPTSGLLLLVGGALLGLRRRRA